MAKMAWVFFHGSGKTLASFFGRDSQVIARIEFEPPRRRRALPAICVAKVHASTNLRANMEIILVLTLLLIAVVLFATEKFPVDFVAILVLGTLLALGLVTPQEGISGFSNPATITVGAMFVLSAALRKTGALGFLGRTLLRFGKSPSALLLLVMLTVGVVSAFINNTAAVAVFLPMVLTLARRRNISPAKLLIPLSYASQFGGVCTLIGTSTNLLVSSISEQQGRGQFSMFEFAPLGLIMLAAGTLYLLFLGRWVLPDRPSAQLTETYQLGDYIIELRVQEDSPLSGRTIATSELGDARALTVLEILREKEKLWRPLHEPLRAGDVLLMSGKLDELMELRDSAKLAIEPRFKLEDETLRTKDVTLIEVLIAPRSRLIGATLSALSFSRRYNAIALAIQRRGQTLREQLKDIPLQFGDALLLQTPRAEVERLRADENFIVLAEVEEPSLRRGKAPLALAITALVVGAAAFGAMPILVTALLGCAAIIATRCISLDEAYAAIDWKVIFLLAGILPLGIAMQKSGAAELVATHTLGMIGSSGPLAALAAIYLLTAVLTEMMSNNAAAILIAPISISTATALGVDPKPFLIAVCFAASTSFATPVGYQTNTMVHNIGGYRFTDFMRAGIPLNLIFWVLAVYFIPKFWPL